MRFCLLIILFVSARYGVSAQADQFKLSNNSLTRLQAMKDPAKRLRMYKKYFTKDSLNAEQEKKKKFKKQYDSLTHLMRFNSKMVKKKMKALAHNDLKRAFGTPLNSTLNMGSGQVGLNSKLQKVNEDTSKLKNYSVNLDMIKRDSSPLKNLPINRLNDFNVPREIPNRSGEDLVNKMEQPVNGYSKELNNKTFLVSNSSKELSQLKQQSVNLDSSLRVEREKIKGELRKQAEMKALKLLRTQPIVGLKAQADQVKEQQRQYESQLKIIGDSSSRREQMKALSLKALQSNRPLMDQVQHRLNKLMKKYSYVPNSNDLSTAIKKTSLKGRTFKERMVIASNFQLLTVNPVTIDFSPMVGYKFNARFSTGLGLNYRQAFSNTSKPALAPQVFGAKVFSSYDVLSHLFAYVELDRSAVIGKKIETGENEFLWQNNFLVGLGRRVSVHKKIDITITLLYSAFAKPNDTLYPQHFMVRMGFQLSEAGLLKPKAYKQ